MKLSGLVNASSYPKTKFSVSNTNLLDALDSLNPNVGFIFSFGLSKISILPNIFCLLFAIPRVATLALFLATKSSNFFLSSTCFSYAFSS